MHHNRHLLLKSKSKNLNNCKLDGEGEGQKNHKEPRETHCLRIKLAKEALLNYLFNAEKNLRKPSLLVQISFMGFSGKNSVY